MQPLVGFFGLSLLDALNPSALAVTLLLLLRGGPYRRRVVTYASAIFTTYLLLGVAIFAGFDGVLRFADSLIVERLGYAIAAVGGSAMLFFALIPLKSRQGVRLPQLPEKIPLPLVFTTGVTITVVEFSTAFPYIGAIGLLRGFTGDLQVALGLLTCYVGIFVLPPLLLMVGYTLGEDRLRPRMQTWLDKRKDKRDDTWLWILGIVGFLLAKSGIAYYLSLFGFIR